MQHNVRDWEIAATATQNLFLKNYIKPPYVGLELSITSTYRVAFNVHGKAIRSVMLSLLLLIVNIPRPETSL